jgi:hypothetical protein
MGEVVLKGTSIRWTPPTVGFVKLSFLNRIVVPNINFRVSKKSLDILTKVIIDAPTAGDRTRFMRFIFLDIFVDCDQLRRLMQNLRDAHVLRDEMNKSKVDVKSLRSGAITKKDVFLTTWSRIIDSYNKFGLVTQCFPIKADRKQLANELTYEQYKFSWDNATGYYKLDLANPLQYSVMLRVSAVNTVEAEFGKNTSRRQDTSQRGNWYNFRNEKYNNSPTVIDMEFLNKIPRHSRISFDFVSTTRPSKTINDTITQEEMLSLVEVLGLNKTTRNRPDYSTYYLYRNILMIIFISYAVDR